MKIERAHAGLLLLRAGAGISLALVFGWPKLEAAVRFFASGRPWPFVDFNRALGLPAPVVVACLQTLNESIGALLVAGGLVARPAATCLAVGFAAATACSLRVREPGWITAGLYALGFATLAITGPGAYALDQVRARRRAA